MQKIKQPLLLALVILVQLLVLVGWAAQKQGYHVDEIYSHTLANSQYRPFIQNLEGYTTRWQTGQELLDALTVNESDAFDFGSVVYNQTQDVHPPLWYFVLHTVSSLSQGVFSKWQGILINLIWFVAIDLVLFALTKAVAGRKAAWLSLILWGFSAGAINAVTFVRMYTMLAFWGILFVYLHWLAFGEKKPLLGRYGLLAGLFFCTIAGVLTQYYFLIFAFFLCGVWCIYLLVQKRWKELFTYAGVELAAVVCSVALYPSILNHLTSSGRGMQSLGALVHNDSYLTNIQDFLFIGIWSLFGGFMWILPVLAFLVWCCKGWKLAPNQKSTESLWFLAILFPALMGYLLLIARIAPYRTDRYIMILFPIGAVYIGTVIWLTCKYLLGGKGYSLVLVLCLVLIPTGWNMLGYLFMERQERYQAVEPYQDLPVLAVDQFDYGSSLYADELVKHPAVLFGVVDELEPLTQLLPQQDLSHGLLVYTSVQEDGAVLQKVEETLGEGWQRELVTQNFGNVYRFYPVE